MTPTPHQVVLRALHRDTTRRPEARIALETGLEPQRVRRVLVELQELGMVACTEGWPAAWSLVGRDRRVMDERVRP